MLSSVIAHEECFLILLKYLNTESSPVDCPHHLITSCIPSCTVLSVSFNYTSSLFPPPAQPGPPVVTIVATTDSTITLTWNTTLHCFESEMFTFVVIWDEIGSGTSTNVTTSSSPYTISGLQPGTSYQISVHGVGGSGITGSKSVSRIVTSTAITSTYFLFVCIEACTGGIFVDKMRIAIWVCE